MSAFNDLVSVQPLRIWDGVVARTVEGDLSTLAVVELDPCSVVAEHSHETSSSGWSSADP